jgi:hypothetical protein
MKPRSTIMAEDRVTRLEFHSVMQTLQSRMNRLEDMMAKQFGSGATSKPSVQHYEFQHQNFGGENSDSHEGSSSRDGMFKPTSIELDEESLENVKDEEKQPRDQIIPEIPESETDPVADITQTKISELIPAENPDQTEIPALHPMIPKQRTSESSVEMQFSDREELYPNEGKLCDARLNPKCKLRHAKSGKQPLRRAERVLSYADGLDFVALKHRWRWKHGEEEEDAVAVETAPKCEAVTSTCSAGTQFGQRQRNQGASMLGEEDGTAVAGAVRDRGPEVREAELWAGDLDGFRCFSLWVLEAAEKGEEWYVRMTKGNFRLCTLGLSRRTDGIHMNCFQN